VEVGKFYFLNNQYFVDFPDDKLMKNKEIVDGVIHDRPCFYSFCDLVNGLNWLIPFSSQITKYENEYKKKIAKYGKCDTIVFGEVLGHLKAFLIQNMCPILPEYVSNEYIDKTSNTPVRVDGRTEQELISKAKRVLLLQRKGYNFIFPDVLKIENILINKLKTQLSQQEAAGTQE
jgi:hypothetical protein